MTTNKNYNISELFNEKLSEVDAEIFKRLNENVPLLAKIGSHLIKAKGKRIIPTLTLAMAALLNDFSIKPIFKLNELVDLKFIIIIRRHDNYINYYKFNFNITFIFYLF